MAKRPRAWLKWRGMSQPITSPLQLLRYPDFCLLILARFLSTVAMLTQSVTLGWQVYSIRERATHSMSDGVRRMPAIFSRAALTRDSGVAPLRAAIQAAQIAR